MSDLKDVGYSREHVVREKIGSFENGVRKIFFDLRYKPVRRESIMIYIVENGMPICIVEWKKKITAPPVYGLHGEMVRDMATKWDFSLRKEYVEHFEYDCKKGQLDLEFDRSMTGELYVSYDFDLQG